MLMGILFSLAVMVVNSTINGIIYTAWAFCVAWAAHKGWKAGK